MKINFTNRVLYLALLCLAALWVLPTGVMAEGDGVWATDTTPASLFIIEEDLVNSQNYLVMTVIQPGAQTAAQMYWGPTSGSEGSTFLLNPLNSNSDMSATWHFNSDTQAVVNVISCSTNCMWQADQVVTLTKLFGDNQNYLTGSGDGDGETDLFEGAPDPAGSTKEGENSCNGGTHKYFTHTISGCEVVAAYKDVLTANGWSATILNSGCTEWGGGAKLEATKGGRYLFLNAGGPGDSANIDLCVWPSRPNNTDCDQECNADTAPEPTYSACCLYGVCSQMSAATCQQSNGTYIGDVSCEKANCKF